MYQSLLSFVKSVRVGRDSAGLDPKAVDPVEDVGGEGIHGMRWRDVGRIGDGREQGAGSFHCANGMGGDLGFGGWTREDG